MKICVKLKMLRRKLVISICFVFFSCFVYVNADLNLQENLYDNTRNSQNDILADFFEDEGIDLPQRASCTCRGGTCVKEGGIDVCKCPPGYGNFTSSSCKECNCGPGVECYWGSGWGGKTCLCKPGYYVKSSKCVDCKCGPAALTCEFVSQGWTRPDKKVCKCQPGIKEKNGKCVGSPCSSNPCKNEGKCTEKGNNFTCSCVKPYSGPTCETMKKCLRPDDCEYPFECVDYGGQNGKMCKRKQCSQDKDCEYPLRCYNHGNGEKQVCGLRTCDKAEDCDYPLKCVDKGLWEGQVCTYAKCSTDGDCAYPLRCINKGKKYGKVCAKCHCDNGGSCRYEKGKKICECDPGFSEKDGKCTACDCGPQGTCKYENDRKKCYCYPGSEEKNGKCTECSCMGGACVKEDDKEICRCPPGFGNFTSTRCKACDCGRDINCMWDSNFGGNKICLCQPGYSTKHGKCEACECGPDSNCEWINDGWLQPEKKVCHCKPGSHEENGKCVD